MGFECGFQSVIKHKEYSLEEMLWIDEYKQYLHNDWALKNYPVWSDYVKHQLLPLNKKEIPVEATSVIEAPIVEFEKKEIQTNLNNWCSSGKYIDDTIANVLGMGRNDIMSRPITKEDITKIVEECRKQFDNNKLERVKICNAFVYKENGNIEIIPCDGVEIEWEDGKIIRVDTSNGESDLYFPNNSMYFDNEKISTFIQLDSVCVAILEKFDFNKNYLYYYRSY